MTLHNTVLWSDNILHWRIIDMKVTDHASFVVVLCPHAQVHGVKQSVRAPVDIILI